MRIILKRDVESETNAYIQRLRELGVIVEHYIGKITINVFNGKSQEIEKNDKLKF